jgi:hypothetical protein
MCVLAPLTFSKPTELLLLFFKPTFFRIQYTTRDNPARTSCLELFATLEFGRQFIVSINIHDVLLVRLVLLFDPIETFGYESESTYGYYFLRVDSRLTTSRIIRCIRQFSLGTLTSHESLLSF